MSEELMGQIAENDRGGKKKILVVGEDGIFTEGIMDYATHLAGRLGYDILTMGVQTGRRRMPLGSDDPKPDKEFLQGAVAAGSAVKLRAAAQGIHCEHTVRYGDLGSAVEELIHEVKRVELVVTESEIDKEEVARKVTIPVFSVISNCEVEEKGNGMTCENAVEKKKPVAQTVGYGLLTAGLYGVVFANADALMHSFTKGGWYAALPITTAIVFSFAHGAFASNLWSLMGIEARKPGLKRQTDQQVVRQRKQAQKRPRVQAYVNPFHKM